MNSDSDIVWVTTPPLLKKLDNPKISIDGKDVPLFLGTRALLFLWFQECQRPFLLPLFFNPFLPISSLILLSVWTYTLMQTDINTQSHQWPVWCLLSIGANSFPLLSLLLQYNSDNWLDYSPTSETNDFTCHCSCLPLRFGDWPLDKTSILGYDGLCELKSLYESKLSSWLMMQTCLEMLFISAHLFFYITVSLTFLCTFHPPPFTQDWF